MNKYTIAMTSVFAIQMMGCSPRPFPGSVRTIPGRQDDGVMELRAFNISCDGRLFNPSLRINVSLRLSKKLQIGDQLLFVLVDSKTLAKPLEVKRYISNADLDSTANDGEYSICHINDIFDAPRGDRKDYNILPEGCFYIELYVRVEGGIALVGRSELIQVGTF